MASSVNTGSSCLLLLICNVSNRPGWPSFVCTINLVGSSESRIRLETMLINSGWGPTTYSWSILRRANCWVVLFQPAFRHYRCNTNWNDRVLQPSVLPLPLERVLQLPVTFEWLQCPGQSVVLLQSTLEHHKRCSGQKVGCSIWLVENTDRGTGSLRGKANVVFELQWVLWKLLVLCWNNPKWRR